MNQQQTEDYLSRIDREYPVRNSAEQKKAFRAWALAEAEKNGFTQASAETSEGHENLIFGDPRTARVIFSAHYDTPRRGLLPNLMLVTNRVLFWLYQLGIVLILLVFAVGAAFAAKSLLRLEWSELRGRMVMLAVYMAVYYAMFFLIMKGPANRRNRNDNTSGTACVMELTRRLHEKDGVALILFDDEEKGKKGSKAFAKANPAVKENALIVNLDCVGNGDTFIFCPSRKAENHPLTESLQSAVRLSGLNARFFPAGKAQMNSDHKSFAQGIGVCACLYKPVIGYYTGRIHTSGDTVAEPENIERLAEALYQFARNLADHAARK